MTNATWNEGGMKAFWAWAKDNKFGHDEVHTLLGVSSLKDFEGTVGEAKTRLMATRKQKSGPASAPAPEQAPAPEGGAVRLEVLSPDALFPDLSPDLAAALEDEPAPSDDSDRERARAMREANENAYAEACKALPEVPALAFTKISMPSGLTWNVTLRAGLSPDIELHAIWSITRQMMAFDKFAASQGWVGVFDGRDNLAMKPRDNGAPAGQNAPPPARASAPTAPSAPPLATGSTPPPQSGGQSAELTFAAESLHGSITDGKTYFKVKGGKFTQYGVTIWEEALTEAGFDYAALVKAVAEKLIAGQSAVFSISGYTAHYQLNDKNKPNKVTKLELTRAA